MHVLIAGRQEGKTTSLMHWLGKGTSIIQYPGWSRVVIVADRQRHTWLKERYWGSLEDFDHRVYTVHEIQTGRFS